MPQVTGAVHEVGVDQLFFSTTDARGVIRHSNNVFIELSRYRRDELSGAPHNIIRHPEMPGGAFKAMWDTLKAGSPFAAYVRNLAADGSEYDVFATVTPLSDGGYLSVRTRPVCSDLFDTVCAIYRDARATEDQAIDAGANRRAAAEEGLGRIAEMLAGAGLSSYEEFQNTALPAEVARREELSDASRCALTPPGTCASCSTRSPGSPPGSTRGCPVSSSSPSSPPPSRPRGRD